MYRLLGCLIVGAVLLVGRSAGHTAPATGWDAGGLCPEPASFRGLVWQGAGSCSAVACHGSGRDGSKGGEYTTWVSRDRHARAYQVLFDEKSIRIVKNLDGEHSAPAHERKLCLDCHAMNVPEARRAPRFTAEDGVACESCHGPAQRWRTEHYLPSWRGRTAAEKVELGMRDTRDLVVRAQLCASCHIGCGDRDVNHDLIAAGHPRLNFEYGLYTAKMPRHWSEREEKARDPDFEARAWLIGQAVSAQAALELLAHRAEAATHDSRAPWPEFAEYDCFACHHGLRDEGFPRRGETPAQRKDGEVPWGGWYYALAPVVAREAGRSGREGLPPALEELRRTMSARRPDAGRVSTQAKAAGREAEGWLRALGRRRLGAGQVDRLLQAVADRKPSSVFPGWDDAAQEYLALGALYQGLTDLDPRRRDPVLRNEIDRLFPLLRIPQRYTSPVGFDARMFGRQLQRVRDRLDP